MKRAILLLEDQTVFMGRSFGADGETIGEVVFNTSMTGYQEIMTDPSYKGQIVTMTYPLIGNYGIHPDDMESNRIWAEGLIVKEYTEHHGHVAASESLGEWLQRHRVVAIDQIDTRALTRKIREKGAMQGIISTVEFDEEILYQRLKNAPSLIGRDLVCEVSCKDRYIVNEAGVHHLVAYDFGIKQNIVRMLASQDCRITVVPAYTPAQAVLDLNPDGIVLSNGPGDPEALPMAIRNAEQLLGQKPILGICLGHQILGIALGGKCYKLKFGHHGGNHPVMDLATKKIQITAQNHGFAIDPGSLSPDIAVTHINLNDQTVEGMRHKRLPVISFQYHPEASPGPHDASGLFGEFMETVRKTPSSLSARPD